MILQDIQKLFSSKPLHVMVKESGLCTSKVFNIRKGKNIVWDNHFIMGLEKLGYEVVLKKASGGKGNDMKPLVKTMTLDDMEAYRREKGYKSYGQMQAERYLKEGV